MIGVLLKYSLRFDLCQEYPPKTSHPGIVCAYPGAAIKRTNTKIRNVLVNSHNLFEEFRGYRQPHHAQALHESRRCLRAYEPSEHAAVVADARLLENKDVMHFDIQILQAGHFGNMRHLACAVAQARRLHEKLN